jgi:adenosylmethionine-8-amino-7-oxononanoate aminotransferase
VGELRQLGLIAAVELVADRAKRTPFPAAERRGQRVALEAQRRGLLLRPLGNVVPLLPPLSISSRALDRMIRIFRDSVTAALGAA